jgi:hypothetical protein
VANRNRPISLGRSIRLGDGDLSVDRSSGSLALVVIDDLVALHQALALAIETQLGSDPVNVTFGFDVVALGEGAFGVRTRAEYLKMQLVRVVAADRRVKDVKEIVMRAPETPDERKERRYTASVRIAVIGDDELTLEIGAINA